MIFFVTECESYIKILSDGFGFAQNHQTICLLYCILSSQGAAHLWLGYNINILMYDSS
jgi:hypothetical protein